MANDVTIRVAADTKDVKTGFSAAKGEIAGLQNAIQQLSQSISTSANAIKSTLTTISETLNKSKEAAESGERTKKMVEGVKGAADLAATGFKALGIEIPEIGPIIDGVSVVVQGFFALCGSMSKELGKSWTDNQTAMTSLTTTLKSALAPSLAVVLNGFTSLVNAFVQSYMQGGMAAQAMTLIGMACKIATVAIVAIGTTIDATFKTIWAGGIELGAIIKAVFDTIVEAGDEVDIALKVMGALLWDAVHLDWAAAKADFNNGKAALVKSFFDFGKKAAENIKAGFAAGGAIMSSVIGDVQAAAKFSGDMFHPSQPKKAKGEKPQDSHGTSPTFVQEGLPDAQPSTSSQTNPTSANPFPSILGAADSPVKLAQNLTDQMTKTFTNIDNIGKKTADDQKTTWKGVADSISGAFSSSLADMIKGTQNFRGMMLNIGNAILGEATKWIQKKVSAFLTGELTQTAATTAGVTERTAVESTGAATSQGISATNSLTQIGHSAAVAAAGAYAAIAKIPIVGPVLAPLAAAAALAGVIALGKSIFSAEGGMGQVPYDGAMFELHKDEMVLPASLATPMRSMLLNPAANNNTKAASNDVGVTHNHYYDIKGLDGQDVHRVLMRYQGSVARAAERAYRYGYKPK